MIIYKNIGLDNIRKKRKENKYFRRCVLDQLKVFGNKKAKHPEHDTQSRPM